MEGGPHVSLEFSHGRGVSKKKSVGAGHYYVVAPKLGSIFTASSHKPFKHYSINPMWISNLLQQQKMSFASARLQYVLCAKGLPTHLCNLDLLIAEHRNYRLLKVKQASSLAMTGPHFKRRYYAVVEECWLPRQRDKNKNDNHAW